jgi:hypothetical protein
MALTKETVVDQITITEFGTIQYREATRIMEDGVELSKTYHRTSLAPDSNPDEIPFKVQVVCNAIWTPEVIDAYKSQQEANKPAE